MKTNYEIAGIAS